MTYRVLAAGYAHDPADTNNPNSYGFTDFYNKYFDSPQINQMPAPLTYFIAPDSSPGTSVDPGSTYSITARRVTVPTPVGPKLTNETLAQVTSSAQVDPALKFGVFPEYYDFYMVILAETYYQVMVVNAPGKLAPSDVKGVPIIGVTKGSTQCGGTVATAEAGVRVDLTLVAAAQCPLGQYPSEYNLQVPGTFTVGVPESIEVFAQASLYFNSNNGGRSGFANASADPSFEIDPTFPYAKDFQLVYSPGFDTPTPGIPEPATFLMLAAAAPLAIVLRQRSRRLGRRLSI